MRIEDIVAVYLTAVEKSIKDDAASKGQKIPDYFRQEISEEGGRLYTADYLKYLAYGRGPGKFPPPGKMLEFVKKNPDILAGAKALYKNITEKSLSFLIGRKIAREGTDIYQGKKPGLDLKGSIEAPRADFLKAVAYYQAVQIGSSISKVAA